MGECTRSANIVERALLVSKGEYLHFLPLTGPHIQEKNDLKSCLSDGDIFLDEMMSQHIRAVLNHVGGKIDGQGRAAEVLQINPSTLRFCMKKLGIERKLLY